MALVTTAPAPIKEYSPISFPQTMVAFAPMEAPRLTRVLLYSCLRTIALRGLITFVNTMDGPRKIGWVSEYGMKLKFDEQGNAVCSESGEKYTLKANKVEKLS